MQAVEEGEGLVEELGTDLRRERCKRGEGMGGNLRTYRAAQLFLQIGQPRSLHLRHEVFVEGRPDPGNEG